MDRQVFDAVRILLKGGHSYPSLSVATIAETAEVARSTFYVHFADKTELLIRLASETTADIFDAANEWVEGSILQVDSASGREALLATCRRIVADYREHSAVLSAVMAAAATDSAVADYWFQRIDAFAELATIKLRKSQAAGLVDESVDARSLAQMAAWSIERTVSQTVSHSSVENDEQLAATLARGLWLMIFGDSPLPR